MTGALLLVSLAACGALSTPPEPVVGTPLRVLSATAIELEDVSSEAVSGSLGLRSGLRREGVVQAGAFELSGVGGVIANVSYVQMDVVLPRGGEAQAEWHSPLERSVDGGLRSEVPLVLSGTLWLESPGVGTQLVPFTVPVRLLDPETP